MMIDIFSTSCSNKPKEYNSEQEVFVTRDPSYQENRTHYEDTHTETFSLLPPRHLSSMGGWGKTRISVEMLCFTLVLIFSLLLRGQNKCGATSQKSYSVQKSS